MADNVDLADVLQKGGFKLIDLIEFAPKIHGFLDIAKNKMHILKLWEDGLKLKPNQRLQYAFIPSHAPNLNLPELLMNATDEEKNEREKIIKKNADHNELFICVQVIEENDKGDTLITELKYTFKAFESAAGLLSLIPKD